jgi:hypothetical protein
LSLHGTGGDSRARLAGISGMTTQVNTQRFLEMVAKSRLIDPEPLAKFKQKLHEKYGEVVRIAPDTLSYSCSQAWIG